MTHLFMPTNFDHSPRKRNDILKSGVGRVLFATELEFPKILVPRVVPHHTSNVHIECTRISERSKQLYSSYVISFLEY